MRNLGETSYKTGILTFTKQSLDDKQTRMLFTRPLLSPDMKGSKLSIICKKTRIRLLNSYTLTKTEHYSAHFFKSYLTSLLKQKILNTMIRVLPGRRLIFCLETSELHMQSVPGMYCGFWDIADIFSFAIQWVALGSWIESSPERCRMRSSSFQGWRRSPLDDWKNCSLLLCRWIYGSEMVKYKILSHITLSEQWENWRCAFLKGYYLFVQRMGDKCWGGPVNEESSPVWINRRGIILHPIVV